MNERTAQPEPRPPGGGRASGVRFDATVHTGARNKNLLRVADLDLDRVNDPEGQVRVLLTPEDCARLLDSGYEVRLHQVLPVQPLAADLVERDASATAWLEDKVRGIERAGGP